eukprot:m51a1_g432 hypothetical protein (745) ;mRNA; f:48328-50979
MCSSRGLLIGLGIGRSVVLALSTDLFFRTTLLLWHPPYSCDSDSTFGWDYGCIFTISDCLWCVIVYALTSACLLVALKSTTWASPQKRRMCVIEQVGLLVATTAHMALNVAVIGVVRGVGDAHRYCGQSKDMPEWVGGCVRGTAVASLAVVAVEFSRRARMDELTKAWLSADLDPLDFLLFNPALDEPALGAPLAAVADDDGTPVDDDGSSAPDDASASGLKRAEPDDDFFFATPSGRAPPKRSRSAPPAQLDPLMASYSFAPGWRRPGVPIPDRVESIVPEDEQPPEIPATSAMTSDAPGEMAHVGAFGQQQHQRQDAEQSHQAQQQQQQAQQQQHGAQPTAEQQARLNKVVGTVVMLLSRMDSQKFFSAPVDDRAAPGYYSVITAPMDFATVRERMRLSRYQTLAEFYADVRQIVANALAYYPHDSDEHVAAQKLAENAERLVARHGAKLDPAVIGDLPIPELLKRNDPASCQPDGSQAAALPAEEADWEALAEGSMQMGAPFSSDEVPEKPPAVDGVRRAYVAAFTASQVPSSSTAASPWGTSRAPCPVEPLLAPQPTTTDYLIYTMRSRWRGYVDALDAPCTQFLKALAKGAASEMPDRSLLPKPIKSVRELAREASVPSVVAEQLCTPDAACCTSEDEECARKIVDHVLGHEAPHVSQQERQLQEQASIIYDLQVSQHMRESASVVPEEADEAARLTQGIVRLAQDLPVSAIADTSVIPQVIEHSGLLSALAQKSTNDS